MAKAKIAGKKSGQSWLVDLESLKSSGLLKNLVPPPPPESRSVSGVVSTESAAIERGQNVNAEVKDRQRKQYSLSEFRLYQELLNLRSGVAQLISVVPEAARMSERVDGALDSLVGGFFEYSRPIKAQFYRNTRTSLARLWLGLDLLRRDRGDASECPDAIVALQTDIQEALIPHLSGTLKNIEKGRQVQSSTGANHGTCREI